MTQDVLYTDRWNDITRRPALGHEWLDVDTASSRYQSTTGIDVVDAPDRDTQGVPRPRWVLGIGTSGRVRASFYTPAHSLWRQIDYDWTEGRLWRWITVDYTYPNDTDTFTEDEAVLDVQAEVRPDGTGDLAVVDRSTTPMRRLVTEFVGMARDTYWIDVPEFGNWAGLANPGPSAYEVAGRNAAVHAS